MCLDGQPRGKGTHGESIRRNIGTLEALTLEKLVCGLHGLFLEVGQIDGSS